jgi:hypothetical protein
LKWFVLTCARIVGDPEAIHFYGLSAFRPCGHDLPELFKSTAWAFAFGLPKIHSQRTLDLSRAS